MTQPSEAIAQAPPVIHEFYPYLRVRDARAAIDFYTLAFGAVEKFRLTEPGTGRIGHCELQLGPSVLMLSEEFPEHGIVSPATLGGTTFALHLHLDDVDAAFARAIAAGATSVRPPADQFYGERSGTLRDPFGHEWLLGSSIEHVDSDEMQRRYDTTTESADVVTP